MIGIYNLQTGKVEKRKMTPEEIAEAEAIHSLPIEIDYDEEVNRLIRQKYTVSQEFAVLRQKEDKPDEFAEYNEYCEWCKAEVKRTYNL